MRKQISIDFHGTPLSIEVGRIAKQASGSAYIQYGETSLLVTATAAPEDREGIDFLPLSVDYFEKFSAAGKIPGGFFKREGRQTEKEILTSRLTDRPIRPLFPDGYRRETQVVSTVLSYDRENNPDVISILGASTALYVSDIPFVDPIGAVRVARIDGKLVCNPKVDEVEKADIEMIVAATKEAIVMVEGGANEAAEQDVLDALMFGFESIQPLIELQEQIRKEVGKEKWSVQAPDPKPAEEAQEKVRTLCASQIEEILKIKEKLPRYRRIREVKKELVEKLVAENAENENRISEYKEQFEKIIKKEIRKQIVDTEKRLDTRTPTDIRDIAVEVSVFPRTHGSALFTRGETQAIVTATLGTGEDEQRIDSLQGDIKRRFMLHYNFPAFSVGEVRPMRGPGRREIGHGVLAHRAITAVLPSVDDFPYTMRTVSEITESHGSSSMATVCGAALSLMDAGVPLKAPVAGIAMGLIKEGDKFFVLSDISGDEDHIGDMDFKVAGSANGITAIQMDIKIKGISREVLERALSQAKDGRLHILGKMGEVLDGPRTGISKYAPRIETVQVHKDKIREIIGPGGKMIRSIVERSGAKVDINDDGIVTIASADLDALNKAKELVSEVVAEAEVGKVYKGTVQRIVDFGAFVQILPGKDGLLHVSEIHQEGGGRVENVTDVLSEGDEIEVAVLAVDQQGKVKLSHREVVAPGTFKREERPPRRGGDRGRGGRDGSRGRGGRDRGSRR